MVLIRFGFPHFEFIVFSELCHHDELLYWGGPDLRTCILNHFPDPRMGFLAVPFGATYLTSNLMLGPGHVKSRADKFKDAESRAAQGR